jgi:molybdopterin synthase sulfur carrier subunit
MTSVTVALPAHLRTLARVDREVEVQVDDSSGREPTIAQLIDAVEQRYPMLRGTIRDHATGRRRAYMRYFACGEDVSHVAESTALPRDVLDGREPFIVLGAIAGG